ncbi:MAG: 4Fe-4S binding protein [Actinomycetota bacterium]|nr:4Fe-4S binding protein [Actinomycetota bacterium]
MARTNEGIIGRTLDRIGPRLLVRGAFLLYFVYVSVRLLMFRAWALGEGPFVSRPEAVAGLLPIGSYMSFFLWIKTGFFDPVIPAGIVIIIGAIATSVLFKRGFCGWICPVGTVWEGAAWFGRKVLKRDNFRLPRRVDLTLRGARYVFAAILMVWLAAVSVQEALWFQTLPYYATVDAKMLILFGAPIYLAVIGIAFVSMMLLGNVWCRYLCPLGGVYGACGVVSPCTVVRDADVCIECGKCAKVCHAAVPVDTLRSVRAPECDGCQDCVRVCPADGALTARAFGRFTFPWWVWPLGVVVLWLGIYFVARATGYWQTHLPVETFRQFMQMKGL